MIQVGIVGVGLIGGSLGMVLRRIKRGGARKYYVVGWGRSNGRLIKAQRLGAVDDFSTHPEDVLKNADIVVLCVPVQKISLLAKQVLPLLKRKAVLTDVGSVKHSIATEIKRLISKRRDVSFIGGHPLAGSEKAGIDYAQPHLFEDATVVLTPDSAPKKSLKAVNEMWKDAGAKILQLKAAQHDQFLAVTSHLPHLLAFSLFDLAVGSARKNPVLKALVAGSFRDMTRIAGSDPEIWAGIIDLNRKELKVQAKKFQKFMMHILGCSQHQLLRDLARLSVEKMRWSK